MYASPNIYTEKPHIKTIYKLLPLQYQEHILTGRPISKSSLALLYRDTTSIIKTALPQSALPKFHCSCIIICWNCVMPTFKKHVQGTERLRKPLFMLYTKGQGLQTQQYLVWVSEVIPKYNSHKSQNQYDSFALTSPRNRTKSSNLFLCIYIRNNDVIVLAYAESL